MKKSEAKVYKQQLLALRARLRGDVSHLAQTALKKGEDDAGNDAARMPIHMAEMGSENYDQEFSLSLLENDEDTLQLIESALERIEEGVYGECEDCNCKIPKLRLDAIPFAALCVKCAQKTNGTKPAFPQYDPQSPCLPPQTRAFFVFNSPTRMRGSICPLAYAAGCHIAVQPDLRGCSSQLCRRAV